jgi:hypothetical protein
MDIATPAPAERRPRWPWIAAAAVLVAAILGFAAYLAFGRDSGPDAHRRREVLPRWAHRRAHQRRRQHADHQLVGRPDQEHHRHPDRGVRARLPEDAGGGAGAHPVDAGAGRAADGRVGRVHGGVDVPPGRRPGHHHRGEVARTRRKSRPPRSLGEGGSLFGSGVNQVGESLEYAVGVVAEESDPNVAGVAEQSTNASGPMAVIDDEGPRLGLATSTDRAPAALSIMQTPSLGGRESVSLGVLIALRSAFWPSPSTARADLYRSTDRAEGRSIVFIHVHKFVPLRWLKRLRGKLPRSVGRPVVSATQAPSKMLARAPCLRTRTIAHTGTSAIGVRQVPGDCTRAGTA